MTKKDFFILIIKLFGLYSIILSLFTIFPSVVNISVVMTDLFSYYGLLSVLLILATVGLMAGLYILLVLKSDRIVEVLKLERGFENDSIELGNLNSIEIIKIATLIFGGYLFIENLADFITETHYLLREKVTGFEFTEQRYAYLVISGINVLLGILLMTNLNFVAKVLAKRNKVEQ